jgi:hypothetical protein
MNEEEFHDYLLQLDFPASVATELKNQTVDQEAFFLLQDSELKEIFPNSAGTCAKLRKLRDNQVFLAHNFVLQEIAKSLPIRGNRKQITSF